MVDAPHTPNLGDAPGAADSYHIHEGSDASAIAAAVTASSAGNLAIAQLLSRALTPETRPQWARGPDYNDSATKLGRCIIHAISRITGSTDEFLSELPSPAAVDHPYRAAVSGDYFVISR